MTSDRRPAQRNGTHARRYCHWRQRFDALSPLTFFTAIPMAGLGLWLSVSGTRACWPLIIATLSAAAILVAGAIQEDGWSDGLARRVIAEAATVLASPWGRAAVAGFVAAAALGGATMHSSARGLSRFEAKDRDLRRWYLAQVSGTEDWRRDGRTRVVVFTDYQCPASRQGVPSGVEAVEELRKQGVPIEIIVRDFPASSACNPGSYDLHPAACDAALAVRLVRTVRGDPDAAILATWLYRRGLILTRELIEERLEELGLLQEFRLRATALRDLLAADIQMARRLGVHGTPAFFVNGVQIPDGAGVFARILHHERERLAAVGILGTRER